MSEIAHKLRMAAKPGSYMDSGTLEEAADYIDKLERIVIDKVDSLSITARPPTKSSKGTATTPKSNTTKGTSK